MKEEETQKMRGQSQDKGNSNNANKNNSNNAADKVKMKRPIILKIEKKW